MATTITTGDLNKHFGVTMTTEFIKEVLGFQPAETARAGHPRWALDDVPKIGIALESHVGERAQAKVVVTPPATKKAKDAKAPAASTKPATTPAAEEDPDDGL